MLFKDYMCLSVTTHAGVVEKSHRISEIMLCTREAHVQTLSAPSWSVCGNEKYFMRTKLFIYSPPKQPLNATPMGELVKLDVTR